MRTIRVDFQTQIDATTQVTVSTEAIVGDDGDAAAAGREAREAMDEFIVGYGEDPR